MAVKLSVMVEGLKWVCAHNTVYINIKKNTLINLADPSIALELSEDALTEIEENKEDCIELPSWKQVDTKKIAKNYVESLPDGAVKVRLEKALKGLFPMKKFHKEIEIFEYSDNWYNYRSMALKNIAINFLNIKKIEFEDDISY